VITQPGTVGARQGGGFVALEVNGGFGLPLDLDEIHARLIRTFAAGPRRTGRSGQENA
jgi:hypothetical protein